MLNIIGALRLAFAQLPEAEMRQPLLASLLWTVATLILLWIGIEYSLNALIHDQPWASDWLTGIIGLLAAPVLTIVLFPIIAWTVLGFYAERIVLAVEARYYLDLPAVPATRWGDQIRSLLGLAVAGVLLNLLSLPLYLLIPGANLVLFLALNGYVLGRGYFELVALRRLDWRMMRRLWVRNRLAFTLVGAALAVLFSVPFVNLLAPVIGTAAAVHLFEEARRKTGFRSAGQV